MEFSKADLLKLLSYLEGELQARDIVIATLKVRPVILCTVILNQCIILLALAQGYIMYTSIFSSEDFKTFKNTHT